MALAAFALPSIREHIAPGSTFTLITQNVDGLSPVASERVASTTNEEEASASEQPPLIEMHGRLFDVKCTSCDHVEFVRSSPICESLSGTEQLVEKNILEPDLIPVESLPRCSKCKALARPGVVWFGEGVPLLRVIEPIVDEADFCIVVGTSSTVASSDTNRLL